MQITAADTIHLRIPFEDGGAGEGLFPGGFRAVDMVLLRLETDAGLVGWGEGFGHFCGEATAAMLRRCVAPLLLGRDPRAPGALAAELLRALHLVGRHGPTVFAVSAADIALHDLAAKAEGVSLATWLGGARRTSVPAYASLVRYGAAPLVAETAAAAAAEGYGAIKLHEIEVAAIRAGREGAGDLALTNDVNCNWTEARTLELAPELREIGLTWLEEPVYPPEDHAALARLRAATGVPVAAGENLCLASAFADQAAAGAVDYAQPSVTKVGGIAECLAARRHAAEAGARIAQHSPYFGPGYLATLHLLAAAESEEWFEYLYVTRAAELYRGMPSPERGRTPVPEGPGLGLEPDPEVLARHAV